MAVQGKNGSTKRKVGRPPIGAENLQERLQIRIAPEELQTVTAAAATDGQPVSKWVRDVAVIVAKRGGLKSLGPKATRKS